MEARADRWERLLTPTVVDVGAYSPGVSAAAIKARFGLPEVVRLNWNESLLGPLPGVLDEVAAALGDAWAYPEDSYEQLRDAIARWSGVQRGQVVPGHGIQALTLAVVAAFVEPGDAVVIPTPTYGLYAQACRVAGADVHHVAASASLAFDLDAIATAACRHHAKLVWICDPNNPTGLRLDAASWPTFLDALPDDCVTIIDEAYGEYVEPAQRIDRLADIRAGRPLIVLRTFSKIFGLAGLRLGYALVHETLAPYLYSVHEPFNVNRAALAAGLASVRRTEMLPERRALARAARHRLSAPLRAAGIRCLPSDANFVLVELGSDDLRVTDALARRGLLVRPGSELGLPDHIRITVTADELMDRVAACIVEALGPRSGAG